MAYAADLKGEPPSSDSPDIEKTSQADDPKEPDSPLPGALPGHSDGPSDDPIDRLTKVAERASAAGEWAIVRDVLGKIEAMKVVRSSNVVELQVRQKGR
jgi:hypothetical protein